MKNLPIPKSIKCSPLSAEEYEKLTDLGVDFEDHVDISSKPYSYNTWDESFSELEAFKAKYKHLDVPRAGEYRVSCKWNRWHCYGDDFLRYVCSLALASCNF
jgi:hypothetical protein